MSRPFKRKEIENGSLRSSRSLESVSTKNTYSFNPWVVTLVAIDKKLRKGLWSPDEDEKLRRHVALHGLGSWSSVPQMAGLQRCGKSCRLRWINYLRPDLKRGDFTPAEEKTITELHNLLGNRWSRIAAHLPGRTDNEIKNYWNSCIKKKLTKSNTISESQANTIVAASKPPWLKPHFSWFSTIPTSSSLTSATTTLANQVNKIENSPESDSYPLLMRQQPNWICNADLISNANIQIPILEFSHSNPSCSTSSKLQASIPINTTSNPRYSSGDDFTSMFTTMPAIPKLSDDQDTMFNTSETVPKTFGPLSNELPMAFGEDQFTTSRSNAVNNDALMPKCNMNIYNDMYSTCSGWFGDVITNNGEVPSLLLNNVMKWNECNPTWSGSDPCKLKNTSTFSDVMSTWTAPTDQILPNEEQDIAASYLMQKLDSFANPDDFTRIN